MTKPSAKKVNSSQLSVSKEKNSTNYQLQTQNFLKIGQAAKILGVSIDTLRRWEIAGKIKTKRTPGNTRLYPLSELERINPQSVKSIKQHQTESLDTEELLRIAQNNSEIFSKPDKSENQIVSSSETQSSSVPAESGYFFSEKNSLLTKFLLSSVAILTVITLATTSWTITSYLVDPEDSANFFKNNVVPLFLKPFDKRLINLKSAVLAVTTASRFLEINSDTQINGSLFVRDSINNLQLEATPSAGTISLISGPTTLDITNSAKLDQDVSTIATPTFSTLNLSATSNQLVFQSGGPTGTLTWNPTATRTITLPDATTTLVGTDTTQTLTNKTISGSSNTFSNISNSALSNNKVTVSAGTNLTGGGDVSLGSSLTLSLKDSISLSSTLTVTGASTLSSSSLAIAGVSYTFPTADGSSSTVLTTNGSGTLSWGSAAGGWSDDGSTVRLSTNTDNVGIGTSSPGAKLSVAGNVGIGYTSVVIPASGLAVSGNVGIGTTSPTNALTVIGSANFTGSISVGSCSGCGASGSISLDDGSASSPSLSFSNDADTGLWRIGANQIALTTAGSTFSGISINSSGNLGIGTTSATSQLQTTGNVGIGGSLTVSNPATLNGLTLNIGSDATGDIFYRSSSGPISRLAIGISGQALGISLGVPTWTDVSSFSAAAGWVDAGAYIRLLTMGDNVGIGTTVGQDPIGKFHLRGNDDTTSLTFVTTNNSNSVFGLSVLNNGNVGIGSTSSGGKLVVMEGNVGIGTTSPRMPLEIWGNGTYAATFLNGNVGIGTTETQNNLQIGTQVSTATSTPITLSLGATYSNSAGANPKLKVWDNGVSPYGFGVSLNQLDFIVPSGASYDWYINGVEKMRLDSNGNLGIGATLPNATLAIQGNVGIGYTGANQIIPANGLAVFGNVGIGITTANSTLTVAGNAHIGSLYQGITAPTNGLFVDGNVGIGATTSSNPLDVWGNGRIAGTLTLDSNLTLSGGQLLANNGTSALPVYSFTNSTSTGLYSPSSNALALNTNGSSTPPLTITAAGNVGIGTTAPTQVFDVSGLARFYSNTTQGTIIFGTNDPNRQILGNDAELLLGPLFNTLAIVPNIGGSIIRYSDNDSATGALSFSSNTAHTTGLLLNINNGSISKFVIDAANGNVGIGTSIPNSTLSIQGNVGIGYTGVNQTIPANGLAVSGNVGIGITTANSNLSVAGNAALGQLYATGNTAPTNGLIVQGNVGIGTSLPLAQLHVLQVGSGNAFRVDDVAGDATPFVITTTGRVAIGRDEFSTSDFSVVNHDPDGDGAAEYTFSGGTALATAVRLDFTLDARADNGFPVNLYFSDNGTGKGLISLDDSNPNYTGAAQDDFEIAQLAAGKKIHFITNNGTNTAIRMTLDNNGNLGIGTSAAGSKLQVSGNAGIGFGTASVAVPANGLAVSGNVGIGITTANSALTVNGGVSIGSNFNVTAPTDGLLVQGNVGIGFTTPAAQLHVVDPAFNGVPTGASIAVFGSTDGTTTGVSIRARGTITGALADFGEYFPFIGVREDYEYGDIVGNSKGEAVSKTTGAYDPSITGIVTKASSFIAGADDGTQYNEVGQPTNRLAVALLGRVPVKVSTENGAIKIGDYLTSSSIPGVVMKATRPGQVVGKALAGFDSPGVEFGKILAFVSPGFSDPNNFLSSLTLDNFGNLIIPKIKTSAIFLDPSIASSSAILTANNQQIILPTDPNYTSPNPNPASNSNNFTDLGGKIASLEERIADLETANSIKYQVLSIMGEATQSAEIAEANPPASESAGLNLTPPDILLASSSAKLTTLTVSEATVSAILTAYQANISDNFKVLGQTTLGKTSIAGDVNIDGTFSIENGSELNILPTLYLQKSSLASTINIFNGKVGIDSEGNIQTQAAIISNEVTTNKLTINTYNIASSSASLTPTIGSATLPANQIQTTVLTTQVSDTAKIFITPTSPTDKVLSVANIKSGESFDVSILTPAPADIKFNWWLVESIRR